MISESEYAVEKSQETSFLAKKLDAPMDSLAKDRSIPELRQLKRELREKCVQKYKHEADVLSGNGLQSFKLFDTYNIQTTYQRFDMRIVDAPFYAHAYCSPLSESLASTGFYTNCGMSAVSSVLIALTSTFGEVEMSISSDAYFETNKIVRQYFPNIRINYDGVLPHSASGAKANVIWIDSISKNFAQIRRELKASRFLDLIVFDTTCFELSNPEIKAVIDWCSLHHILCVLVRSHSKLDFMGLDYSKLGSVSILYPKEVSGRAKERLTQFVATLNDVIGRFGFNFSLESLNPFHGDDEFHRLNTKRIRRIQKNTSLFQDYLESVRIPCTRFTHGVFATVPLLQNTDRKACSALVAQLLGKATNLGVNCSLGSTFGGDSIKLDSYFDAATNRETVRFSLGDGPSGEVLELAKCLTTNFKTSICNE